MTLRFLCTLLFLWTAFKKQQDANFKFVPCYISLTIVAVIAIISIMVCCLAALGYNSKISIEKEKIEVDSQSNFNQR